METKYPKDLFLESLKRCSQDENFIPSFYEKFLSSSDEVRKKFIFTDFEVQNRMLLRSLELVAAATEGDTAGLRELTERAETHNRHNLNIEPKLYDLWKTAVIETAREFDNNWNEDIENAWNKILSYAINRMIREY